LTTFVCIVGPREDDPTMLPTSGSPLAGSTWTVTSPSSSAEQLIGRREADHEARDLRAQVVRAGAQGAGEGRIVVDHPDDAGDGATERDVADLLAEVAVTAVDEHHEAGE
jgi:hypothetical protein